MKLINTILFCFISVQSYSQNIDSLINRLKQPSNMVITIKTESIIIDGFPARCEGIVTFKLDSAYVYYFVLKYNPIDSVNFWNAQEAYLTASDCNFIGHKDFNNNFFSFEYYDYFFLLELCPCKTGLNEKCAELAKQINLWRKVQ